MARGYMGGGASGSGSDDCTARAEHVLAPYTAITSGSDDEPVAGTLQDKSGTAQQAAASLDAANSRLQMAVPAAAKYSTTSRLYAAYSAIRTLIGLTADKLWAGNTILGLASSRSALAAKTWTPGTANQTIAAGTCITGAQTIKGDANLTAANIKNGVSIFGKTGTYHGTKKAIDAMAVRGYGAPSSEYQESEEDSFTMPANGVVYYGGFSAAYGGSRKCTCEIYKNGTLVDSRNIDNDYYWRGTMFSKSFSAAKGDVVKVKCTVTSGTCASACMQAVIIY